MPSDRWRDLCAKYQPDDGLPTRRVGQWTEDKLYFWNRYVEITTTAMVGHPKWPAGIVYVDLFAGPGICEIEDSKRRMPGSVLIAANAPKPFNKILVSELDSDSASAIETRLAACSTTSLFKVFRGDCNTCVHEIVKEIPHRSLTLAFIDPENLGVEFSTVAALSACGRVDLLLLFADRMDIVRNVDLYERQQDSLLDRMMGPASTWREKWRGLDNRTAENISRLFAEEYRSQLSRHLGYREFGEEIIRSARGPLYRLIFASKNERGLDFWTKVTQKDRGGQMGLQF